MVTQIKDKLISIEILKDLGIEEEIELNDQLDLNLGIDSQEILEINDLIKERYNTKGIKEPQVKGYFTIAELEKEIIETIKAVTKNEENFYELVTQNEKFYPIQKDRAVSYIWDFLSWPEFMPHVNSVQAICNNSQVQEFRMDIDGDISVRSLRYKDEETSSIYFFQPEPPKTTQFHAGRWDFDTTENGVKITLTHLSVPNYDTCSEEYGTEDKQTIKKNLKQWLDQHGQQTIENWANYMK